MTNIAAVLLINVVTNWSPVGTLSLHGGGSFTVEEGRISTNVVAIIEWQNRKHEIVLESHPGPSCGERRAPAIHANIPTLTNPTNCKVITNPYFF